MSDDQSSTIPLLTQIDNFKAGIEEQHERRLTAAGAEGVMHGGQNLPPNDQSDPPPYQDQMRALYQQDLAKMQFEFGETVQTKYAHFVELERKLGRSEETWDEETQGLLEVLREQTREKENAAEKAHSGKLGLIMDILDNQITAPFNLVKSRLEKVRRELRRAGLDTWLNNPFLYFVFLALIGLSEYPLNAIVFADLRLDQFDTLLLSGTLIIAIPLAAHFAGIGWKRRAENRQNMWIAIMCTAAVTALSWYIGVQRFFYIEQMGDATSLTAESALTSRWILFGLSLLLYGLATLLAYGHHDRNAALQEIEQLYKKAKKKYDKEYPPKKAEHNQIVESYKLVLAGISSEFLDREEDIRGRRERLERRVTDVRGQYDADLKRLQAIEELVGSKYEEVVRSYQTQNVVSRANHRTPDCFSVELPGLEKYFSGLAELDPNPTLTPRF